MRGLIASFILSLLILNPSFASIVTIGVHDNYRNDTLGIGVTGNKYKNTFSISNCPSLTDPILKDIQRITMEIMVICHAVKRAGIGDLIQLRAFPNTARGISFLRTGYVDILGNTLFPEATEKYPGVIRTEPIIRDGEFVVGLFTTSNRDDVLSLKKPEQFKELTGVSVHSWVGDIKAMKQIKPKHLMLAAKRELLAKMIEHKRADFTFSYLTEPVVTRIGGELIRIDGFKVSFEGDRAFAISPSNSVLNRAINSYLGVMRSRSDGDAIKQAFIHAGFITTDYDSWVDLRLQ